MPIGPDQRFQYWEQTRTQGPWRFILLHGVLVWGLRSALLFAVVWILFSGEVPQGVPKVVILAVSMTLFPVGGVVLGQILWWASEKSYQAWPQFQL